MSSLITFSVVLRGAFVCLLVLALSVGASKRTEAGSVTYPWSWSLTGPPTNFPLFNPSPGMMLTQVTVSGELSGSQGFLYFPQIDVMNGTFDYSFNLIATPTVDNYYVPGGSGTWDGTGGVGGVSGGAGFTINVNPSDFILIPGQGTGQGGFEVGFNYSITSPSGISVVGGGPFSTAGDGTITYYFVPEPSSATLGAVAVAMGLGYWWRRRANAATKGPGTTPRHAEAITWLPPPSACHETPS